MVLISSAAAAANLDINGCILIGCRDRDIQELR